MASSSARQRVFGGGQRRDTLSSMSMSTDDDLLLQPSAKKHGETGLDFKSSLSSLSTLTTLNEERKSRPQTRLPKTAGGGNQPSSATAASEAEKTDGKREKFNDGGFGTGRKLSSGNNCWETGGDGGTTGGWTNAKTFLDELMEKGEERRERSKSQPRTSFMGGRQSQSRSKSRGRAGRTRSRSQGGRDASHVRREKFMPRECEETELFEEKRQIAKGMFFDDLYDDDSTIQCRTTGEDKINGNYLRDFEKCQFSSPLMNNIKLKKYEKPTGIQRVVMPIILRTQNDLMAHAHTGSGKTAAFLIPIISQLQQQLTSDQQSGTLNGDSPYCLILAPTKELVQQLYEDARAFAINTGVSVAYTYGDIPMKPSLANLAAGCDIFVSTCGRLEQFVDENYIKLDQLRYLVLDEADKLLKIDNFLKCIRLVKKNDKINPDHRVLMFSATFEQELQKLAQRFLRDSFYFVQVGEMNSPVATVNQKFLLVSRTQKQKTMTDYLLEHKRTKLTSVHPNLGQQYWKVPKTIVFVEHKRQTDRLAVGLLQRNIRAHSINSDHTLKQRVESVGLFASSEVDVLVATDVAARGLNFPEVEVVINYDLPSRDSRGPQNEYIHRIGRTGRLGNTGESLSYFDPDHTNDRRNAKYFVEVIEKSGDPVPDWLEKIVQEEQERMSEILHAEGRQRDEDADTWAD